MSSSSVLVSNSAYTDYGNLKDATDANGIVQRTTYDDGGRRVKVTDNYVDGMPGGGADSDNDRVVEYVYTSGLVTTMTRKMPSSSDDQATAYTYGTTTAGSAIATGHLLASVTHPEQTSGQSSADRKVTTTYNAQGQTLTTTDCEGNVIETAYDTGGRVTLREVTTFASGYDTRVKKVATTYSNRGQTAMVQQLNSSSVALDEVSMAYDDWGNLKTLDQDPDSSIAAPTGQGYARQTWTHEANPAGGTGSGGGWRSMITKQWFGRPDVLLNYGFGSGGSIDDLLGRTATMTDGYSVQVAAYVYMGVGTVVGASLPEPKLNSEMFGSGGSSTYATYMDAFNRPIKQRWVKTGLTGTYVPPVYVDNEIAYSYTSDVVGVRDNAIRDSSGTPQRVFDQLRSFDNLRRLKKQTEGEAATLGGAISPHARYENFARNLAGRVTSDQVTLNSDTDYVDGPPDSLAFGEMDDTRTYNKRNELRTRSVIDNTNPSTARSVTLTYDLNGNLTGDGEKYTYKYNPWCQLVEVKSIAGGTPVVVTFVYNGMGHRVGEKLDTSSVTPGVPDGVVDGSDPWFYIMVDTQGRRVATFRAGDSYSKETFVYHAARARGPGFAGGIVLRDREGTLTNPVSWAADVAGDTREERTYACSDFRGNVSALVSGAGTLVEQYRYSATGVPMGIPLGDADGDGKVDGTLTGTTTADYVKTEAARVAGAGAYSVEMDADLDGKITTADVATVTANNGLTLGRGKMSAASVGWRVGWRGMEWVMSMDLHLTRTGLFVSRVATTTHHDAVACAGDAPEEVPAPLPASPYPVNQPNRNGTPDDIACYDICMELLGKRGLRIWGWTQCRNGRPISCNCSAWIKPQSGLDLDNVYEEARNCTSKCEWMHQLKMTCSANELTPVWTTPRQCSECAVYGCQVGCLSAFDCSTTKNPAECESFKNVAVTDRDEMCAACARVQPRYLIPIDPGLE